MNKLVAEYDYYAFEQERKIILTEEKKKKRKKMELYLAVALLYMTPFLFFLHWLIIGY